MKKIAALLAVLWMLGGGQALAAPEDVANEVSQEIMSPYCPGVTLHDCPSGAATDLRYRIATWAEDGWSKERILDHLEAEFGDVIRATPPSSGAGLIAWILPALAVLGGAIAVVFIVKTWSDRRNSPPPPPISGSDRKRLETELGQFGTET